MRQSITWNLASLDSIWKEIVLLAAASSRPCPLVWVWAKNVSCNYMCGSCITLIARIWIWQGTEAIWSSCFHFLQSFWRQTTVIKCLFWAFSLSKCRAASDLPRNLARNLVLSRDLYNRTRLYQILKRKQKLVRYIRKLLQPFLKR